MNPFHLYLKMKCIFLVITPIPKIHFEIQQRSTTQNRPNETTAPIRYNAGGKKTEKRTIL